MKMYGTARITLRQTALVFAGLLWLAVPYAFAPVAVAQDNGMPNALQGFSRNKSEPVKIESNKLEVRDKEKLAIFTGNVFVQQGDTTMRSPELRVFYEGDTTAKPKLRKGEKPAAAPAPAKSGKVSKTETNVQQKIKRIEALGGVIVTSKDQKATGDRADFEMKQNIVILTGNVVVSQGQNVMTGNKLVVDLNSSRAHMEGGRVRGLFVPSEKDDKSKSKPKKPKSSTAPTQ